uniref:Peptidase S1 domain-containing protein n=1 Tax=Parastrongyloides trichosuri TaxID=131310 RepID=A0A0N4ZNI1_PARTI
MSRYNHKTSASSSTTSRKHSTATTGVLTKSGTYRKNSRYQSNTRKMSAPVQRQRDEKRKVSSTKSSQSHKASTTSKDSRQHVPSSKTCCQSLSFILYDIGQESNTVPEFISHCLSTMFPHKFLTLFYILLLIFSSLSAYFGLVYINKCPIKPEISFYLLTNGILSILQISMLLMRHRRKYHDDFEEPSESTNFSHFNNGSLSQRATFSNGASTRIMVVLIWILLIGSFIIGNYVVFSVYRPPGKQNERSLDPTNWCNEYVYNFALIQLFLTHALIIFTILLLILFFILAIKYMFITNGDVTEEGGVVDVLNQWSIPVNEKEGDVVQITSSKQGGRFYFHISRRGEYPIIKRLTEKENEELQEICGKVTKNHLKKDEGYISRSKKRYLNGTDFEGREFFKAISYAFGKVPDGTIPWAVSLGVQHSSFCTGTIISPYHVATAAHCLFKYETSSSICKGRKDMSVDLYARIYYGGTCLKKSVDGACRQSNVKEKFIRRISYSYLYNKNTCNFGHDIAIIEVDSPFVFDDDTHPICLPPSTFNEIVDMPKKEIIYNFGFGKTETNMSTVYLRRGKSLLCNTDKLGVNGLYCMRGCKEEDEVDCLGSDGNRNGICRGDSGGGDYIRMNKVAETEKEQQRYMLFGVHSAGQDCAPDSLDKAVTHNSVRVTNHVKEICWLAGICPKERQIDLN